MKLIYEVTLHCVVQHEILLLNVIYGISMNVLICSPFSTGGCYVEGTVL